MNNHLNQFTSLLLTLIALLPGCGGFNTGEKDPDGEIGSRISVGDIAVVPDSEHFIIELDEQLIYGSISSGELDELNGAGKPERVLFNSDGSTAYLLSNDKVKAFHLEQKQTLWEIEKPISNYRLAETAEKFVIANQNEVCLHALETGVELACVELEETAVTLDIDILELSNEVILTTNVEKVSDEGTSDRITELVRLSLMVNEDTAFEPLETISDLPACAVTLRILADESKAILSSPLCVSEAVTAIRLDGAEPQITNLPGTHDVAIANNGSYIVSFVDARSFDPNDFPDPEQIPTTDESNYHLVIINGSTLDVQTLPIGEFTPQFVFTPDSSTLLINKVSIIENRIPFKKLNMETLELTSFEGPSVRFNEFVMTNDSAYVFLLDNGLHRLDIQNATVETVELDFTPSNIAITHDSSALILRNNDESLQIFDIQTQEITRSIQLQPETEQ